MPHWTGKTSSCERNEELSPYQKDTLFRCYELPQLRTPLAERSRACTSVGAPFRVAPVRALAVGRMAMSPPIVETIRSHHALRGVAALLVLLFHFRDVTPSIGQAFDAHTAFFPTGFIWLDSLFMLSGFVLSHVYGATMTGAAVARAPAIQRFYLARFARIYPLHLATLLALVAVELSTYVLRPAIADALTGERKTWGSILQHLTLTHSWLTAGCLVWNVSSRSISTEAYAYLLVPVLLPLVDHDRWAVRALLPVVGVAIYVHTFSNFPNVEGRQSLARCIEGFSTGILVHRVWLRKVGWMAPVAAPAQLATVVVALAALYQGWNQALVLVGLAALILATPDDRGPLSRAQALRPLLLLGTLSYSLYMTHWIVYRLYWMFGECEFSDLASRHSAVNVYILKVFVLLVLTATLSLLTYHKIEFPTHRQFSRLLAR